MNLTFARRKGQKRDEQESDQHFDDLWVFKKLPRIFLSWDWTVLVERVSDEAENKSLNNSLIEVKAEEPPPWRKDLLHIFLQKYCEGPLDDLCVFVKDILTSAKQSN